VLRMAMRRRDGASVAPAVTTEGTP